MTADLRIGLSGWDYPAWKDDFYAGVPRRRWLAHAAETFDTIEVNATFYREQKPETYARWRDATPANFRFAIKGSRWITHYGRLRDTAAPVARQRDSLAPLADKIVAVLWQMPASLAPDPGRLDAFLAVLGAWPGPVHALEFRDPAWFTDDTAARLAAAGAANVLSDAARWPMWDAVTADLVYVRLHGHSRTYASAYSDASLAGWADRIAGWRAEGRRVLVYFDNDAEGAAPRDALRLRDRVAAR
jgi:uncharacterized protein YecE (DUF72 family)